jgi:hypothetical protein
MREWYMNGSGTQPTSRSGAVLSPTLTTRLSGALLLMARAVWLVLVVPSLGLFVVGLPVYSQQLQRAQVCGPGACLNGGLTVKDLQDLVSHGISVNGYAAVLTIFIAIIVAIWCAVGFLLFWRRSDDWLALLAAFFLVMLGITLNGNALLALALTSPALPVPFSLVSFLAGVSFSGFFLFFPTGRLVPRWMGLILLLNIISAFLGNFPSPISPFTANWPGWLTLPLYLVLYGPIICSQLYRYRRVSTPVQRQQTKWVVFGVTVLVGVFIGLLLISSIPSLSNSLVLNEVWTLTLPIASLAIPLSIGFSILRYRLYDIDVLINRTLVYGTLTLILTVVYVGLVIGLSALLRGIINQDSGVAIVLSTLIAFFMAQPLRKRLQAIIDRRFYRRKYDAAKTLEAFSATLRHEVDLSQLREHLLTVVQETMQPTQVSLWVRSPDHHGHQRTPWRANPPVL